MAERYEVVIDFAKYKGKTLRLNNLKPKNNIEFRHHRRGDGVPGRHGDPQDLQPQLDRPGHDPARQPGVHDTGPATRSTRRRTFEFLSAPTATGRSTARPGSTWNVSNFQAVLADPDGRRRRVVDARPTRYGGWFHPVHIHLVDFQILARRGGRNAVPAFELRSQGHRLHRRERDHTT